jgi:hypothetical protein
VITASEVDNTFLLASVTVSTYCPGFFGAFIEVLPPCANEIDGSFSSNAVRLAEAIHIILVLSDITSSKSIVPPLLTVMSSVRILLASDTVVVNRIDTASLPLLVVKSRVHLPASLIVYPLLTVFR